MLQVQVLPLWSNSKSSSIGRAAGKRQLCFRSFLQKILNQEKILWEVFAGSQIVKNLLMFFQN